MRKFINPGIMLMIFTAGCQASISAIAKLISHTVTTEFQVLAHYIIPLCFFIPMFIHKGLSHYKTPMILIYFIRGLFAATGIYCFFYAAQYIPLGVAAVLFNSSPIFVPVIARVVLGERTSFIVYVGILISLFGIIVVIHPGVDGFLSPVAWMGLASGAAMAVSNVMLRWIIKHGEPVYRIVFYLYFMCALVATMFAVAKNVNHISFNAWPKLPLSDLYYLIAMLLLLGIVSLTAQRMMTKAFQYLPASKLTPILYLSVPISSLLGWLIWAQEFTPLVMFGTSFVFIGVIIIMFETKIKYLMTGKHDDPVLEA
jgi:drug/metabolite transporter (DMT)-like permease